MATNGNFSFEASILNSLPDPVIWLKPVFSSAKVIEDFEVGYSNEKADETAHHPKGGLKGLCVLKDRLPNDKNCKENFENLLGIFETGVSKEFYFNSSITNQYLETQRKLFEGGVLSITKDRRDQREAEKKEQQSRRTLRSIVDNSPYGIVVYDAIRDDKGAITDFKIRQFNDKVNQITGYTRKERTEFSFRQIIKGVGAEEEFSRYIGLVETGVPFAREQYIEKTGKWTSASIVKFDDGFLAMLSDITELKDSQHKLQEESLFNYSIINASLNAIYVLEAIRNADDKVIDFVCVQGNQRFTDFTGMPIEQLIGKSFVSLFPHAKESGLIELMIAVIEKDEPRQNAPYYAESFKRWYDYSVVKRGENSIVVTFQEITQQRETAIQIEQQKNLLDNILQHSSNGISVSEVIRDDKGKIVDALTVLANDAAVKYTGIPKDLYLSKKASELDPNLSDSAYFQVCLRTLETGEPIQTQYFLEGTNKWLEISVSKMNDDHLITIFTDVTESKEAQLKIEQGAQRLAAVFNSSQSGMFTFAPVYNERHEITDFRFVITNPTFAAYVQQTSETLNGELGSKWFPAYIENGVFEMYKDTFETGETRRIDIHYNDDGLDIFLDVRSTKVGEEVLVTFTDYTQLKKVQLQLEKNIEELKKSNVNLEEFAYAASHDLKEPIRKIHFFTDRLKQQLSNRLDSDELNLFNRLEQSAKRMALLIDDLLAYSHVSNEVSYLEEIDLGKKIQLASEDLELEIHKKQASLVVGPLPTIIGHKRQIQQLFQNLISNSLKYSKPNVPPQITISCNTVVGSDTPVDVVEEDKDKKYYMIEVKDNGIGFEQKYADTIFKMFKRLHGKSEYAGTGIGLSIARKVVENHQGYIWAESYPDSGATFKILLPVS